MEMLLIRDNLNDFLQYNMNKEINFNKTFRTACGCDAINIIKYLATSTPYIIDMNKSNYDNNGFDRACRCGYMNVMIYLIKLSIKHPIYKLNPINIYFDPILGTGSIALYYAIDNGDPKIISYIISLGNNDIDNKFKHKFLI